MKTSEENSESGLRYQISGWKNIRFVRMNQSQPWEGKGADCPKKQKR